MPRQALIGACACALFLLGCSASAGSGSGATGNHVSEAGGSSPEGGSLSLGSGATSSLGAGGSLSLGGTSAAAGGDGSDPAQTCDGKLTGYVRDFNAAEHPDFEPTDMTYPMRVPGKFLTDEPDIIEATLGPDQKPVYAKGDGTTSATTTGAANFASWFHDTPGLNPGQDLTLHFTQDPNDPTGMKWSYDTASTNCCF